MRAQQDYLFHHPLWLKRCRLPRCPSHVTLGRRYKALTPTLEAFTEYVAAWHLTHGGCFRQETVYEDKSLFKAAGPVWHQKDRRNNEIPKGLRGVDTTATWSKSGYHGWVYGYGLHLIATHSGFPVMFHVEPANANERNVLDTKKEKLIDRGTRCVVADNGYVDKKRALLTPKITLDEANALLGADPLYTATQIETYQKARKTAIEPVFDLLSKLLSITGKHKPLPVRNLAYVSTFLGLGILLLQVSMLMNIQYGIPTEMFLTLKPVFDKKQTL